ncbi:MAG: tetratricopeptide repeat protein, partial [Acidobacteriota bacterium]
MPHCAPVRRVTLPAALGPAATFWLTTAVWLTIAVWLAAAAPAVALDLDRPAERTLAVGETHSYRLGSVTGPFRLIAEQLGIDLAIEIIARDGSILATFDGPVDRWGVETLWFDERLWVDERQWIDNAPSPQRIDVRASRPRAAPGRYRLTLEPAEGPLDASRREAERATTTAARLAAERTVDGWRAARVHARQARILWQELEAPRRLARTVHALAALHQQLGEVDAAAELFDEAARRWQSLGDDGEARTLRALALGELGVARIERGELDQARQALHQALTRNLEEGRRFEAAGNRMDLGLAAHRQGDLHEARGLYRQALATYRELGDLTFEA